MQADLIPADLSTTSSASANPFRSMFSYLSNSCKYDDSGFLTVQEATEHVLLQRSLHDQVNVVVTTKLLPSDESTFDFMALLPLILPPFFMLAFLPSLIANTTHLVKEKTSKMKHYLQIMGLQMKVYWLSWAITFTIPLMFTVLVTICFGYAFGIFAHNNALLVSLFFLLFASSLLTFSFVEQAVLSSTTSVAVLSLVWMFVICFLLPYLPANRTMYICLSFISPVAFCLGLTSMIKGSAAGQGISWTNAGTAPEDDISFATLLAILGVDCALYMLLAWYLTEAFPGEYGTRRPPWFPFTKSYWAQLGPRKMSHGEAPLIHLRSAKGIEESESAMFEACEEGANQEGVVINGLSKTFREGSTVVKAVDNVSLTLFRGQIFSLLGPNGAGKTTIVSMLTGLVPPSEGDAFIEGCSVKSDLRTIRGKIGVCPQEDLLYDNLTAEEHLTLFGRLKGIPVSEIERKVKDMLASVDLGDLLKPENYDKATGTFSGGMKRKLSLAIALMGDPQVIFLDEPTSGIDPLSRHRLWGLLKTLKERRTIVLTTHSMEEADLLSDRICIMAEGRIKCGGTPTFLKSRFGVGYYLCMNKEQATAPQQGQHSEQCDSGRVLAFVSQFVHGTRIVSDTYNSLTLLLPQSQLPSFGSLFEVLEKGCAELHVESYGLSNSSLEDVFVRITTSDDLESDAQAMPHKDEIEPEENGTEDASLIASEGGGNIVDNTDTHTHTDHTIISPRWHQQFVAVVKQKLLCHWRNRVQLLVMDVLPAVILMITLIPLKLTSYDMPTAKLEPTSISLATLSPAVVAIPYVIMPGCREDDVNKFLNVTFGSWHFQKMDSVSQLDEETFSGKGYSVGLLFHDFAISDMQFSLSVMFNQSVRDSPVAVLDFVEASLAQLLSDSESVPFSTMSYPVASTAESYSVTLSMVSYAYLALLLGFMLASAVGARQMVCQRERRLRDQLYLLGLRVWVYVTANWAADFVLLFPSCILVWLVCWAFQVPGLSGLTFLLFVPLCVEFLAAIVIMNHLISYMFSKSDTCTKWIVVLDFVFTILPIYATLPLILLNIDISKVIPYALNVLPTSAFMNGMNSLVTLAQEKGGKESLGDALAWNRYFDLSVIGILLETAGIAALVLLWEYNKQLLPAPHSRFIVLKEEEEDEDVQVERKRVESRLAFKNSVIVMDQVTKCFHKGIPVVNNLALSIQNNVCFGLLGPNGAGKTTTVGMMSADMPTSRGTVFIRRHTMTGFRQPLFAALHIGRCLQQNTLFDYLTGREHLDLYLSVQQHIWSATQKRAIIERSLRCMGLEGVADRITKHYSGGNGRKLCVALATLPGTEVIFLDEPSTGMDPVSRRGLWDVIQKEREAGRVIVLTTHSMEEAEKLCTQLAVIVNGSIRCLGTVQHLKSKFGRGYRITLDLAAAPADVLRSADAADEATAASAEPLSQKDEGAEACERLMHELFPDGGAQLQEQFLRRCTYKVAQVDSLARVFRRLEEARVATEIAAYSICQTTLEEVFVLQASASTQQ
eukprot:TRINITY_DN1037_c0_g1_i2.p1 TRINITY_DN1037_c0_g1~~TRINITY_DN1037_c0_g1_i2.p1  ORF type:complete len:1665 (-),score=344.24 TRINITY_DN1037_c0_g1_i2:724-5268(-)